MVKKEIKMVNKKMTTIQVDVATARRLNLWKYDLGAKSIDEVIDRILKIIPASELKQQGVIK